MVFEGYRIVFCWQYYSWDGSGHKETFKAPLNPQHQNSRRRMNSTRGLLLLQTLNASTVRSWLYRNPIEQHFFRIQRCR